MTHNKEAIIEFAKELYLTPNEQGNHKYSLRDICSEILQKFYKNLTAPTILEWSKRYGWDKLWAEGVRQGITEAVAKEISDKKTKEEQFVEAIANKKRQDFTMDTNIKIWAYNLIKEKGFENVRDALFAFDMAMKHTQGMSEVGLSDKNLADVLLALLSRDADDK